MFDLLAKDLAKVSLLYAAVNEADICAVKVKLNPVQPWLEIVCGKRAEEEVFLIADTRECQRFSLSGKGLEISSISCRTLDRKTGMLTTLELSRVVALEDGVSIRYGLADGTLLHPLTLDRDKRSEKAEVVVLFSINTEIRRRRKAKTVKCANNAFIIEKQIHQHC